MCLDCDETPGICSLLLTLGSLLIVLATLPLSLLYTIKVVQVSPGSLDKGEYGGHQSSQSSSSAANVEDTISLSCI